jgi:hypothetical protein
VAYWVKVEEDGVCRTGEPAKKSPAQSQSKRSQGAALKVQNHRPLWTFVRPLLVLRSTDSLDSRRLAEHPDALIRRHPDSKLTPSNRRLNPRMLWYAPPFRFSRQHRHTNEQYECAYADQGNCRRRTLTRVSNCRWHGQAGVQQDRFGFSRHPKFTDRSPISEAGGPIQIVGPDFAGKDLVAKNLLPSKVRGSVFCFFGGALLGAP